MDYKNLKLSKKFDKFILVWSVVYLLAVSLQNFLDIDTRETEDFMLIFRYVYPVVIIVYWAYDNNYKLKYGIAFWGTCILFGGIVPPIITALATILFGSYITMIILIILLVCCPFFLSAFYQFFKIQSYMNEEKKRKILKNTEKPQEIQKTEEIKNLEKDSDKV